MVNDSSISHHYEKAAYIKLFDALAGHNLLLEANPPFFTILAATAQRLQDVGLKKEAVIGKALFEAHPGNTNDPTDNGVSNLRSSLDYVLRHKEMHQLPVQRYDLPDEHGGFSEKYWRASNRPVLDEEGEVAYIIHTAEEITHEVKAGQMVDKMKGMEQAYNLFMQTPIPICIFKGPELIIELANKPTLQLWGRTEEVIGLSLEEAVPEVKGQGYLEMINKVRETGISNQVYESPVTLIRNGKEEVLYINYVYEPYYEEGHTEAVGVLAIGNDVTDKVLAKRRLKENEVHLELLSNTVPAMIFYLDAGQRYQSCNETFMQWFGVDKEEEVLGKTVREFIGDKAYETVLPYLSKAYGGEPAAFEINAPSRLGVERWLSIVYTPHKTDTGTVTGVIVHATDITQTKEAELALAKSERNYHNLIYSSPFAIGVLMGPDLVITTGNAAILEIWGKGASIFGKPYFEALPELAAQGYREVFNGVFTTGKAVNFVETPVEILQGGQMTLKYYNFILYPQRSESGEVEGIGIIASEVTPQALLNKKIKESEERFNNLIQEATVGIVVLTGQEMKVAVVNKAYGRLIGRSAEEMLDKNLFDLIPEAEANFRPILEGVRLSGEPSYLYDTPYAVSTNGQKFEGYLNVVYQPYREIDGTLTGVMALCQDVSEQVASRIKIKESEERFRNLADDSPMFVFIIDPDPLATVSYWNKTWLHYTGQTLEEGLGRAWDGIIHPDDVPVVMKYYGLAFQNKQSYLIPAVRVKRHDGVYRWHTFKGNPRYLPSGEFNGYVGVGFDVHEQKITEEGLEDLVAQRTDALQQTNKELQRSNQNLEEFAHAASHDLKEPIRKITFFSHQLRDQLTDRLKEAEKFSFSRIENATERMGNLIDDLLLYSHVSHRPHETEAVDLNVKVQRVLEDLELDVEEKKAVLNVGKLPVVQGYRRQLQQLFQNLISNALKYSKSEVPPHINISAEKAEENNRTYHVILVRDNGIGFDQQYAEKIFQMFARLHGKSEYSGTGVGLSIVKKVVENHHGFIRVESEPGMGSIFKIYLPLSV